MGFVNEEALKLIAEGARKLAGEQIVSGKRKGIGMDGQEICITIAMPEKPEVEAEDDEPMIKKKMKEYGIEVD